MRAQDSTSKQHLSSYCKEEGQEEVVSDYDEYRLELGDARYLGIMGLWCGLSVRQGNAFPYMNDL